jgi:hypothetical protein
MKENPYKLTPDPLRPNWRGTSCSARYWRIYANTTFP